MNILFLIIGLAIGATFVFIFFKEKLSHSKIVMDELSELKKENIKTIKTLEDILEQKKQLEIDNKVLETKEANNKEQFSLIKESEEKLRNLNIEFNNKNSILITENKNLEEKLNLQKEDLEKLNQKFTTEFENIANRLFDKSSEKINKQGSEQLNSILKPFKDKLSELKTQISNTYDKDTQQRIRLHEQVKQLFELNQQISSDAQNLTNALKSNSKIQGDWGEEILENILQQSGLRKGYEYETQSSFTNNEGKQSRPDMIIHYPDNRDVIIDSKVSLTNYEQYISAENTIDKETALKRHIQSIKQHIKELSDKNYQDIFQIESLDFVMMFVPIEGAYYIAIEEDKSLWQYAYEKKIVLINPTNLITALKMISNIWQQDYQNKNVMEIARQSGGLYDSFILLLDDISKMESSLNKTQELFSDTKKRIATGRGNLIGRVEKIKKLGAKTKKSLPDKFNDALDE